MSRMDKRRYETNKLSKRLFRQVGAAIADYRMIEDGDVVMVCLSGGKDSYTLLDILQGLQARAPIDFEIIAFNLDQKQPGFPDEVLSTYLKQQGVRFHIEAQDTYSVVKRVVPEGKTMCSLCSRLRRGVIYRIAESLSVTKIALGHHQDDIIETFFLNLFFGGRMKAMPPKLRSNSGKHTVIRPLAYCVESDLQAWATHRAFPIIPCNLCGAQSDLQRVKTKQLIQSWRTTYPGRVESVFRSLQHVVPSHLLDRDLYDFSAIVEETEEPLLETASAPIVWR